MIALDASLAVMLALNEPLSMRVRELWTMWAVAGERLIAPALFQAETLSAIRKNVNRRRLSEDDADRARYALEQLLIETHEPPDLYDIAWDLAKRFNRPNIYDCCYLALATIVGCDFWTADARLAHAVQPALSWVRLVG